MSQSTLLIVDDEPEIRETIAIFLEPDHIVHKAANGKEALQILKAESIDLILTDFHMPELDGFEMIRTLQELGHQIPVIMLTGCGDQELHRQTLAHEILEYLEKPCPPAQLIETVERCLDKALMAKDNDRGNLFAKHYYEEYRLKIRKETAKALQAHCAKHGLSLSSAIEELVAEHLRKTG